MPKTLKPKARKRVLASTTSRGYGAMHQRVKSALARLVATGTVRCARGAECLFAVDGRGGFIRPGDPWDLGHLDDRSGWSGPEHRKCNRGAPRRRKRLKGSRAW